MQYAELDPGLPAHFFTAPPSAKIDHEETRPKSANSVRPAQFEEDEFGFEDIDDKDLVNAGKQSFFSSQRHSINATLAESQEFLEIDTALSVNEAGRLRRGPGDTSSVGQATWAAEKLKNGKWACNHKCKDKAA